MPKNAPKMVDFIKTFFNSIGKLVFNKACSAIQALLNQADPKLYNLNLHSNNPDIQKASKEQNSRRLLDKEIIDVKTYAATALSTFGITTNIELVIDRTNYSRGKSDINFLVLAVVFKNTAIPLYWQMLDNKGGSSNSDQRIELVSWFTTNFPEITIAQVYADREFPSAKFITDLIDNNVNFIFRSKDVYASEKHKKVKISTLYPNLKHLPDKTKTDDNIRRIYNQRIHLHVRLNDKNEKVYLVSNKPNINAFQLYRRRWTIENMFGHFKSKGCKLESSRITNTKRLSNLFLLMSIAYIVSVKMGNFINHVNPIKTKIIKEQGKKRATKEFSLFNYGYNFLKNIFTNYLTNKVIMKQLHKLLNSPPNYVVPTRSALFKLMVNF